MTCGNIPLHVDGEDQELGPSAGSPGTAEQTSVTTPTDPPQQAAALCSTTLLQETLTCKPDITQRLLLVMFLVLLFPQFKKMILYAFLICQSNY